MHSLKPQPNNTLEMKETSGTIFYQFHFFSRFFSKLNNIVQITFVQNVMVELQIWSLVFEQLCFGIQQQSGLFTPAMFPHKLPIGSDWVTHRNSDYGTLEEPQ